MNNYNNFDSIIKELSLDNAIKSYICVFNHEKNKDIEYNDELISFINSRENNLKIFYDDYDNINVTIRYKNMFLNQHHWTTTFVWNIVIPFLMNKFNILQFNPNDFYLVNNIHNGFDLSYHEKKNNQNQFFLFDLNRNLSYKSKDHETVLRTKNERSPYHDLFRGWHKSSFIKRFGETTNRKLLCICDSMMIPIIPILSYYFDKMLIIDNREFKLHQSFKQLIMDFKPNYFLCGFISSSYILKAHEDYLK